MSTGDSEDSWINNLIEKSSAAKCLAYCPYSKFPVGAALLSDDGTIFTGCNVENASYPVGICAERTAISKAVSEGHRSFKSIAIISDMEECISPCGMCRQMLAEFGVSDIICAKSTPVDGKFLYQRHTLDALLPFSFGPRSLKSSTS